MCSILLCSLRVCRPHIQPNRPDLTIECIVSSLEPQMPIRVIMHEHNLLIWSQWTFHSIDHPAHFICKRTSCLRVCPLWLIPHNTVLCYVIQCITHAVLVGDVVLFAAIFDSQLDQKLLCIRIVHELARYSSNNRDVVHTKISYVISKDFECQEASLCDPGWQRCVSACFQVLELQRILKCVLTGWSLDEIDSRELDCWRIQVIHLIGDWCLR